MDSPQLNIDKICRACLSESAEMFDLFENTEKEQVELRKMLITCTSIEVSANDGLPAKLCNTCVDEVNKAYTFRQKCRKSDTTLRAYVSKFVNGDSNEGDSEHTNGSNSKDEINCEDIIIDTYICDVCKHTFANLNMFNQHSEFHDGDEKSCIKCSVHFETTEALHFHMYKHIKDIKSCICKFCDRAFRSLGYLKNHLRRSHPGNVKVKVNKYQCSECDKSYTTTANLTIHMYSHTGVRPFVCEHCGRSFTKSIALNSHIAIHTGQRSHLCNVCGRGFTSAAILNQHRKIHTGERPYKCKCCSKSFTASGDLTIHMRVHTGEKPYLCPTCGSTFARITHLNTHIRTHTGERPYVCSTCGRGFAQSGDLRSHERIHTGEKPYVCLICGKRFIQSSGLSSHMSTHTGVKTHFCTICNRGFAQSSSLIRHYKAHKSE